MTQKEKMKVSYYVTCGICGKQHKIDGEVLTIGVVCDCIASKPAWICVRCNKVNAPWREFCDCGPMVYGYE